jgi:hypothetical protein
MNQLKTVPLFPQEETSPVSKLWFAVIAQALVDAEYPGNRRDRIYMKIEAINWFKYDSKDFNIVFHLAGYEEFRARKKVEIMLKNEKYSLTDTQYAILNKKKYIPRPHRESQRFKLVFP